MREPLTIEDLDDLMMQAPGQGEAGHRELAAQLLAWAEDPQDDDTMSVADLLVRAGEQLQFADDIEGAMDAYRAAADRPETTVPDARAYLVHMLLELGQVAEAEVLSEQLRKSRPQAAATYDFVGETWEVAGELDRANRWMTRGMMLAQEQRDQMAFLMLAVGRLRVRRAIGFPPDIYDEMAAEGMRGARAEREAAYAAERANQPGESRASRRARRRGRGGGSGGSGGSGSSGGGPRAVIGQSGDQTTIDLF
jgi:hypothetical protein